MQNGSRKKESRATALSEHVAAARLPRWRRAEHLPPLHKARKGASRCRHFLIFRRPLSSFSLSHLTSHYSSMPAHTNALAALPRHLRVPATTSITRTHLLALYKEQLRIAHSFPSYNFKQYFLRRTRNKFRTELPALLDSAYAAPSSSSLPSSSSSSSSTPVPSPTAALGSTEHPARTQEDRLREWYAESLSELAVIARSAIVNSMYEAPKLVVEGRGRIMATGGGGAGAEARCVVNFLRLFPTFLAVWEVGESLASRAVCGESRGARWLLGVELQHVG